MNKRQWMTFGAAGALGLGLVATGAVATANAMDLANEASSQAQEAPSKSAFGQNGAAVVQVNDDGQVSALTAPTANTAATANTATTGVSPTSALTPPTAVSAPAAATPVSVVSAVEAPAPAPVSVVSAASAPAPAPTESSVSAPAESAVSAQSND